MQKQLKVDVQTRKRWTEFSKKKSYEEIMRDIPDLGRNTIITAFTKFMATPKSEKIINDSITIAEESKQVA